jgi:cytochrome c-type biogenesis protein CcmH
MTVFWIVAALFLLGALLVTLAPLLRGAPAAEVGSRDANLAAHRDQLREVERDLADDLISPEHFAQARTEIEHRVIEDISGADTGAVGIQPARRSAIVLALLIPLGSVFTYLALGRPDAAAPQVSRSSAAVATSAAAAATAGRHAVTPEQIEGMVTALAERLKSEPNSSEDWLMLGRSYAALGRYRDAAIAMRRAYDLSPGNAGLIADLADIVGMAQGKRLAGEPARLVQQALDIDPRHAKALALAGSVAFEAKDYAAARGYWERLVAVLPPDAPILGSVRNNIAQARSMEDGARPVAATASAPVVPTAATVSGTVELSPALASRVSPGHTLFVFARAAEGPRMPLAIVRHESSLPFAFKLDDSMAMSPQLRLSGFAQVVVGARLSRSGNATPQPGDLIGQSAAIVPGVAGVRVVIDQVQP